jgi:glycosyltransferase involved in cell wall biosynthesis
VNRLKVLTFIETLGMGGGAESLLAALLPSLRHQGVDCDVVTLKNFEPDFGVALEGQGFRVTRLNIQRRRDWLSGLLRARRQLAEGHHQVLWSHMFWSNAFAGAVRATSPRTPLVLTFHGNRETGEPLTRAERAERHVARRLATVCVGASIGTTREFADAYGLSNAQHVYNGVDVAKLEAVAKRTPMAQVRTHFASVAGLSTLPDDAFVVVVPSRYVAKKGHAVLLDALAQLRRRHALEPFVFGFGFGEARTALMAKAHASGLKRVFFEGPLPFDTLISALAHSDLVVLPSLREPFGLAAAEAMAVNTPTLLSNVDGLKEIVGDAQCALLAEPGDVNQLAERLAFAMRNEAELKRLTEKAKVRVQTHFDMAICAARWATVLREATQR